ncbi:hypothetical protein KTE58_15935, partial [Burkholderia multivorans]|uniref:hypothetical protein n=1 Tax=Burkholderia multivorans TaxID=87883 RepID=UPI001C2579E4
LTAMLLHQSNGTLTDFRRKFVVLAHGSIFSKVGASSKPGAIHLDGTGAVERGVPYVRNVPKPAGRAHKLIGKAVARFRPITFWLKETRAEVTNSWSRRL